MHVSELTKDESPVGGVTSSFSLSVRDVKLRSTLTVGAVSSSSDMSAQSSAFVGRDEEAVTIVFVEQGQDFPIAKICDNNVRVIDVIIK